MHSFLDDFEWAIIRLATYQADKGGAGRLLFATVTLLTSDRPTPSSMEDVDSFKVKSNDSKLYFRRTVLKAKDAVEWYRSIQQNSSKTPQPSKEKERSAKYDNINFDVSNFIDNPIWPSLGLPVGESLFPRYYEESNPAPFIGNTPSRLHRRFGNNKGFDKLRSDETAISFIERRLHINLNDYPEYLGSIALVVPDPIVKKIDNFLVPATDTEGDKIFYRFVPRAGKTLDDLTLIAFDQEGNLLTQFEVHEIPKDGVLIIDKTQAMGTYGYAFTHPIHGVLAYQPPAGFLRQMNLSVNVVDQQQKVIVPETESSTSPENTYLASKTSNEAPHVIGDEPPSNVNLRIGIASRQREKAVAAKKYYQRWFSDGSRTEAMDFIRERIGKAKERIIIADPYFGLLQIPQFLPAVRHYNVEIILLTSRLAFEGRYDLEAEENVSNRELLKKNIKKFDRMLKLVSNEEQGSLAISVKVLLGKKPILHDRFMIVDNEVWFLGNSLNMLGERASMIIKLPNPDEVIFEIEKMIDQAKSFEGFEKEFSK